MNLQWSLNIQNVKIEALSMGGPSAERDQVHCWFMRLISSLGTVPLAQAGKPCKGTVFGKKGQPRHN